MKIKTTFLVAAAAAAAISLFAADAAMAETVNLDYTGSASGISDTTNLFDLGGATSADFEMKYVFDPALAGPVFSCCGGVELPGGLVDAVLTINGHSVHLAGGNGDQIWLQQDTNPYAEVFSNNNGLSSVWSFSHTLLFGGPTPADFTTPFSITGTGYGSFFSCDTSLPCNSTENIIWGDLSPTRLDVTLGSAAVPEPSIWATMLLGVGMIGAGLRMTRRKGGMPLTAA
jgi:hypothetical protein